MPGPGRNQPCPCGSGRKVKRCCGERRGPSHDQLDRAFLAQHARWAATEIGDLPTETLARLWNGLAELPDIDLSLVLPLPTLITPELAQLLQAARDDEPDSADDVMDIVVDTVDTPQQRAALAHAVIHLRDSGRLSGQPGRRRDHRPPKPLTSPDPRQPHQRHLHQDRTDANPGRPTPRRPTVRN